MRRVYQFVPTDQPVAWSLARLLARIVAFPEWMTRSSRQRGPMIDVAGDRGRWARPRSSGHREYFDLKVPIEPLAMRSVRTQVPPPDTPFSLPKPST